MSVKYYLLDTNIFSHYPEIKQHDQSAEGKALQENLKKIPQGAKIFLCSVSAGEIEYGLRVAPCAIEEHDKIRKFIDSFLCLSVNRDVATKYYADLRAKIFNLYSPHSRRSKQKRKEELRNPVNSKELQIQENDLWICAVALAHNLILVTHDGMDPIKKVVGSSLQFEDWLAMPS